MPATAAITHCYDPHWVAPVTCSARLLLFVALLAASCGGSDLLPPSDGNLALGTWGGNDAGVIVTDSAAHVHVGCTYGDMPGTIPLDANGHFVVEGSYVLRAYPIQVGPSLPAQFSGTVRGRVLTLVIAVNDTIEKRPVALGPISVVYDREPSMGPCPICRAPQRWMSRAVLEEGFWPTAIPSSAFPVR